MRSLKDSWKEAPAAIEELEKDGDVLVTRTSKDQQMRMVFWNEIKPEDGSGGVPVEEGQSTPICLARATEISLTSSPAICRISRTMAQTQSPTRRRPPPLPRIRHVPNSDFA